MKTLVISPSTLSTPKLVTALLVSTLALSACNKADNSEPPAEPETAAKTTSAQEVPVMTPTEPAVTPVEDNTVTNDTEAAMPANDEQLNDPSSQVAPPTADPDVAIIGTQISNVDYKNDNGQTLKVVYETSVSGELNATTTLPSGKKVKLTATAGQGNNPTYTSADGSIDLVSHAGGGSVDLIQNSQPMSFNAVSAEAEVIPQ